MSRAEDKEARKGRVDADAAEEKEQLDEKLDEALEETFPASDPVAVTPGADDESDSAER